METCTDSSIHAFQWRKFQYESSLQDAHCVKTRCLKSVFVCKRHRPSMIEVYSYMTWQITIVVHCITVQITWHHLTSHPITSHHMAWQDIAKHHITWPDKTGDKKKTHHIKWLDVIWRYITSHDMACRNSNHISLSHVTSQPTTLLHLNLQPTSWHHNTSHHGTWHHHHGTAEWWLTQKNGLRHRAQPNPACPIPSHCTPSSSMTSL